MAHFDRPAKTDIDLVAVHAKDDSGTILHKAGCSHTFRVGDTPRPVVLTDYTDYEDWFQVAPCAAIGRNKGVICDKGGCGSCQ